MIAMGSFGITMGTWSALTSAKFQAIGQADRQFRAVQAAESALAQAREGVLAAGAFKPIGHASHAFEGELAATPRADGLREIAVTIRWTEPGNRKESVRLATLMR